MPALRPAMELLTPHQEPQPDDAVLASASRLQGPGSTRSGLNWDVRDPDLPVVWAMVDGHAHENRALDPECVLERLVQLVCWPFEPANRTFSHPAVRTLRLHREPVLHNVVSA